jgi:hypothetical protein
MPLVTLGGDVGSRDVGWAVLDDTLLAHGVWDLKEAAVDWPPEAWLAAQAHRQIHRSRVTRLALEVFHWRRTQPVIPEAARIQPRVGARFALGRPRLTVVGDPAAAWMKGVMGWLPDAPLAGLPRVDVPRQRLRGASARRPLAAGQAERSTRGP